MSKLTVAVLAIVLAGSASAAGWKDLTLDASSEEAFEKSLAEFMEELTPARASVFGQALQDIWIKGSQDAEADQREYTAAEYYKQVHGLGYAEITTLTDPTGKTAKRYYRAAYASRQGALQLESPWPVHELFPPMRNGNYERGGVPNPGWDPSK